MPWIFHHNIQSCLVHQWYLSIFLLAELLYFKIFQEGGAKNGLSVDCKSRKFNLVQNCFFNELIGYRKANFRPLTRRLPHSSNVNHCTITIWPKGRWSLLYGLGPKACLAKHISGIWIRNLPVPKDTLACCACLSKCNYVPKMKKKKNTCICNWKICQCKTCNYLLPWGAFSKTQVCNHCTPD